MTRIVHLLDDFAVGGVTRALSLFEDARITARAHSRIVPIGQGTRGILQFDADMIVLHIPPSWRRLPFLAALRLRNPKTRIVQVEHSYTRGFEALRVRHRARFRALLRLASRFVDEIVAVSHRQREWLIEAGIPARKVATIHPWCGRFDLSEVPPLTARSGPLRLLAYGRFSPEKNFVALVKAMAEFSPDEATLTLFGAGSNEGRLRLAASQCDTVRLQPACPDPAPFLAECDAVVVPSLCEAFGLVATEARMAGRALLTSEADGLPEQLHGGAGISLAETTPDHIASGIRRLIDADLVAMGAAGRDSVARQHDEIIAGWQAVIARATDYPARSPRTWTDSLLQT